MHLLRLPSLRGLVSAALVSAITLGGVIATGGAAVQAASTITTTFSYTGSTQTWIVPAGVTSITVTLKGGQGGRGGPDYPTQNADGYQGVVTGTIAVTPGETITLAVGGGGGDGAGGGSAPGGTAGQNPLTGYDGAVGGVAGPAGSSGGGGGSGAATVLQIDGVDIVAGGAGGNGGNGQYAVLIGRVAEDHHVARPDATSTTGRAGYNTTIACGGTCDGGASGAGGGGAQGGDRGDVQYGGATATEWFGFGGAPGANSTAGYAGLAESYSFYSGNRANGSITITYDDGAPGTPINLSTTAETDAVALAWNEPATVGASPISDYVVQYATNLAGPWTTVTDGVSTSLATEVTGLTNGVSYFFRVAATNTQGTGGYATTALGTVPSDIPGAPTVTGLVAFGGGIHVDFTAAPSDAPISGYEYRLDGGAWISGSVVGDRLTISGLTNGREYAVEIRALNVIGAGPASTPAQSATPSDVPEAPTGLQGVGGDGTLDLSWIAPTVDNGTPVSDYVVQTATSPGGPFTTAYQPGTDSTTAFLSGLVNGTTYSVRVAAVNAAGQSAWSATVDVTPYTTPDAPTITLTPGDGSLAVALAGFDGGSDATRYEYQLDGGPWTIASATTDPFTISGLTNGTAYDVAVRVTNAAGTGPASSDVSGTPRTVPAAPSIAAVALDWGAVDVAFEVGSDGGSALTNVEYSIDGGDHWITRAPASTVSPLQITGLTEGATYEVVVRALNAAGASEPSNVSSVRANGVPDAPEVTLVPGDHSLFVHHTTPANGGSPITGYEYSVDGGAWTPTATLESPFVVTGLDNGVEYEVRVRASNGAGEGSHGTASGTPRTVPGAPEIVGGTVAGAEGDLVVDLTAPASDGGSPILNYGYSTDAGATWRWVSPASTATQITISVLSSDGTTSLTGGVEYPVEIRAMNAAGAGPASAVATGITTDVPDSPTVDAVDRRQGGVTVTFLPGANGGATVTQYEYRLGGAAGSWVSTGSLGDTFDIGGLANGPYELEMRALNAVGYSSVSALDAVHRQHGAHGSDDHGDRRRRPVARGRLHAARR